MLLIGNIHRLCNLLSCIIRCLLINLLSLLLRNKSISLNLRLIWLMYNLPLNSLIFSSLLNPFLRNVFSVFFFYRSIVNIFVSVYLRNIFSLMFDCIIFGSLLFYWYIFCINSLFVFCIALFIRNIFDSRLTFDWS